MTDNELIEKLRMQLTACGVAALSNTEESAKEQRLPKDSPYYSASYQDVCDAVDREMKLRASISHECILFAAEFAYRQANPNSKMDIPSIVYEQVERFYNTYNSVERKETK